MARDRLMVCLAKMMLMSSSFIMTNKMTNFFRKKVHYGPIFPKILYIAISSIIISLVFYYKIVSAFF
jgi:hypothetical protein